MPHRNCPAGVKAVGFGGCATEKREVRSREWQEVTAVPSPVLGPQSIAD